MWNVHGLGGPAGRRLTWRAATTSVLLSVLFLVAYGGTNWLTAQRPASDVHTWFFAWELAIVPYVPALVVPYLSIDLFFFVAAFLCRDERELRVFRQRVVFSILVAAAFFLVLPLKLAWPERPHQAGWYGRFIEVTCAAPFILEYPHNLFPTLHVALSLILADVYARRLRGALRLLSNAWFLLIGASTLLTWQHHLIDVAGGLLLAAFAFHLFRESDGRLATVPNFRVGGYYAGGAAALVTLAPLVWPWGVFLVWPAAALGMVAAGYFGMGPGTFRKAAGRLPLSTRVVFAPVLAGHYLSRAYYRRQCDAWDEVAPGLLVGGTLTSAEAAAAVNEGVTAVLDLTAELPEAAPFLALRYRNLPLLDLTAPTQEQLHEAVAFIAEEIVRGRVFVHCKVGYSRSAAVASAYLLASNEAATMEEAVARLREARPTIVIRPEAMQSLRTFALGTPSDVLIQQSAAG